jgi:malate dehydrogenase (oxaloacetate-decarboxylating)(NADP+)
MLLMMAVDPIVFAMANPVPEIDYRVARATRPDVVMATGRSDYPNQVNNVIAFPHIFRGALDTRARTINEEMKLAASQAIAALARQGTVDQALGRDYVIPKPFDVRLLPRVARAVAEAAVRTGAARVQLDPDAYERRLEQVAEQIAL